MCSSLTNNIFACIMWLATRMAWPKPKLVVMASVWPNKTNFIARCQFTNQSSRVASGALLSWSGACFWKWKTKSACFCWRVVSKGDLPAYKQYVDKVYVLCIKTWYVTGLTLWLKTLQHPQSGGKMKIKVTFIRRLTGLVWLWSLQSIPRQ